jgi:hypothetical protein
MSTTRTAFTLALLALSASAGRGADGPGFVIPAFPEPGAGVEPVVRDDAPFGLGGFGGRDIGSTASREPVRATFSYDGSLGSLTSQQTVRERDVSSGWDDPLTRRGWQADQAWKASLLGPVSVFGKASFAAEDAMQQDARVAGSTGLALQVPVPIGELLLRGGSNLTCSDAVRPDHAKERSEMLLEVQGRCPLLLGVRLEYDGTASPGLTPADHDWVSQEIRLALPVGPSCKFSLGARQRWDNVVEPKAATEGGQLFLGMELKH